MIRRTITLPEDLAAAVDEHVADGRAPSVSRFIQDAVRTHLDALRRARLVDAAGDLDPAEEVALARGEPQSAGKDSPWGRLGSASDEPTDAR